ncbi:amino acid adenylation domain-containing protein [Streptomyces sp. NPDC055099]
MAPERPPAPARREVTVAPLSQAQERLWFIHQAAPASPVYNVPLLTRWHEPIDLPALARALEALAAQHAVLRTTYTMRGGRPVQVVGAPGPVPLEVVSATAPDPDEVARRARAPFALESEAPWRATVWQQADGGHGALLLTIHHIAVDGWSLPALYEGLASAYEQALANADRIDLPEPPVHYAQFALRDREAASEAALEELVAQRAVVLAPAAGRDLALGPCRPRQRTLEGDREGAQHRFTLPAELASSVTGLARTLRVTPFVVLFAAFQAVVQRWSGRERFLLSTVAANRPSADVEGLVGFFVNTVPLMCAPDSEAGFDRLCADSRGEAFRVLTHQRIPFDKLAARLGGEGLADVGFILQNAPAASTGVRWAPPELLPTDTAKQDLSFVLEYAPGGGLAGTVEYATDRYSAATARRIAESYTALLTAAVAAPNTPIKDLPVTLRASGALPHGVLVGRTAAPFPAVTVAEALESALAAADPERIAVECAGTSLTWGELARWSGAVAAHLRAEGAGPATCIPVLAARGPALVAAWVGVLRSGAAFVPLAMDTPAARIAYILEQTAADTVLVCAAGADLLAHLDTLAKPQLLEELRTLPGEFTPPAAAAGPDDPAAVIYTSGTTGRPKGVLVPHRGLLATALWWGDDCGLGPDDRLLLTAGTAFDPAAFNVVETLLAGARLVIADDVQRRDPRALLSLVRGPEGATVAGSLTPSLLHAMLEADSGGAQGSSLRVVYSGGEALPQRLATECAARWGARIVNVYGPTEASCNSTYAPVDPTADETPAIGVPLPGMRAYVLGPRGEELPPGVPGELYVAGPGVALGYLAAPEQTATAFLPDPHAERFGAGPKAHMYRTGDLVVLREDGQLGYLGRADGQLKILGNRIEPAEVVRLIEEHPSVAMAAVHAAGSPPALVAYVELASGAEPPSREDLVRPLQRWLLPAVLPREVYVVDGLPRTANDKVDFEALATRRDRPLSAAEQSGPVDLTPMQRRAALLMTDVLLRSRGADRGRTPCETESLPGPDADFFTLGGHSLLAVRVVAEAERRYGRPVALRTFLGDPTVAGLARALENATPADDSGIEFDPGAEHPASPVQQRLWSLDRMRNVRTSYLAPGIVEFDGPVDRPLLTEAFARALARHPGLRSRFRLDTRARRVVYRTDGPPPQVASADAASWNEAEREEYLAKVCWTPFDLAAEAPARGAIVGLGPERTLLVYGVHHLVSDGWSLDLVLSDVAALYRSLTHGTEPNLPHAAHPAALRAPAAPDAAALEHLLASLREAPIDIELPHDRPRGTFQTVEADQRELALPAGLADRLRDAAAELRCTSFMLGVALLGAALARRGTQRDFLFTFPWAARDGAARASTVGMFVNTLVVRADLTGGPSWRELLCRVRESALSAYRHADTPYDLVAAALQPDRDPSRPAVTPVYLTAADAPAQPPALGEAVRARFVTPPRLKSKYELELTVTGGPGRYHLSLTYLTALFDGATAAGLLTDLAQAAADLADDLENPVLTPASDTQQAPAADLTDQVAALWTEVLDGAEVAGDVNFFDAGGDSLLLMVLMERLSELTGRDLDAADLFEHSTIDAQVAFLEEGSA